MTKQYKAGFAIGLLIYVVGLLATVVGHWIMEWEYVHGPPPSFLIVVLTLFIGFIRVIIILINLLSSYNLSKKDRHKGELLIHGVVFILILTLIIWLSNEFGRSH
jgi:hypothetical protein